jgi:hypothetical protein
LSLGGWFIIICFYEQNSDENSDTTATTLAHVLYYLATHPEVHKRLQTVVDEAQGVHDIAHPLPYLEAVINETLRLKPVVPSGQMRVTPPEGLYIDETWIPGNTIVVVPQYLLQRDARNFSRPLEFLPERWLEKDQGLVFEDRAFFPFTIGKKFSSMIFIIDHAHLQFKVLMPVRASNWHISKCAWPSGQLQGSLISHWRLGRMERDSMRTPRILSPWQCHLSIWFSASERGQSPGSEWPVKSTFSFLLLGVTHVFPEIPLMYHLVVS